MYTYIMYLCAYIYSVRGHTRFGLHHRVMQIRPRQIRERVACAPLRQGKGKGKGKGDGECEGEGEVEG